MSPQSSASSGPDAGGALKADCARCFALCCVVPAFSVSSDFAIDKQAEEPCPHLRGDSRCGIHSQLRQRGFSGCAAFDCFGAGQHTSQVTFGGRDWRASPDIATQMFTVFPVMRQLHELLWYLTEALRLHPAGRLHTELEAARQETVRLSLAPAEEVLKLDLLTHREHVNALLQQASKRTRAGLASRQPDHRGADLIGRSMRDADLRGANLRGAYLMGADLCGADLAGADVTGADLRGTLLSRARLAGTLFLTQAQLDSARGDLSTTVPASLTRPAHWPSAASSRTPVPSARPSRPRRRR